MNGVMKVLALALAVAGVAAAQERPVVEAPDLEPMSEAVAAVDRSLEAFGVDATLARTYLADNPDFKRTVDHSVAVMTTLETQMDRALDLQTQTASARSALSKLRGQMRRSLNDVKRSSAAQSAERARQLKREKTLRANLRKAVQSGRWQRDSPQVRRALHEIRKAAKRREGLTKRARVRESFEARFASLETRLTGYDESLAGKAESIELAQVGLRDGLAIVQDTLRSETQLQLAMAGVAEVEAQMAALGDSVEKLRLEPLPPVLDGSGDPVQLLPNTPEITLDDVLSGDDI